MCDDLIIFIGQSRRKVKKGTEKKKKRSLASLASQKSQGPQMYNFIKHRLPSILRCLLFITYHNSISPISLKATRHKASSGRCSKRVFSCALLTAQFKGSHRASKNSLEAAPTPLPAHEGPGAAQAGARRIPRTRTGPRSGRPATPR